MSALFESWTGLSLLDPAMLALALLLPVAWALRRPGGAPAVRFAPARFLARADGSLPRSGRARLLWVPVLLRVAGLVLVAVALARPVARDPLPREHVGIDILLCVDLSSSMAARDMDPDRTRLEIAQAAAASFIERRPHDRIGLISFARFPDVRCPLTLDHHALAALLADLRVVSSDSPEDATGIGTALARAARVLKDGEAESKVVVLLTDGEENVATVQTPDEIAPLHAAQLCADFGVRVYAITAGIGAPGPDGDWLPLDTRQVRRAAEKTGGVLFTARDAGSMEETYAAIDALEKAELSEPRFEVRERFAGFLLAALLLLALGRVLGDTVLEVVP